MSAERDLCRLGLDGRALRLGYRLGSDALLIVLDLAAHAKDSPEGVVVAVSYRDIARRIGTSKDTVGRRVALLRSAGVLVERTDDPVNYFEARPYLLHLERAGVIREPMLVAG